MRFAYNGPRVGDERRGAIDAFPRRVVSVHVKKKTGLRVFLKSTPVTSLPLFIAEMRRVASCPGRDEAQRFRFGKREMLHPRFLKELPLYFN